MALSAGRAVVQCLPIKEGVHIVALQLMKQLPLAVPDT
jgi:hypothetical protein